MVLAVPPSLAISHDDRLATSSLPEFLTQSRTEIYEAVQKGLELSQEEEGAPHFVVSKQFVHRNNGSSNVDTPRSVESKQVKDTLPRNFKLQG